MRKIEILLFAFFCVYCGYQFAEKQNKIAMSGVVKQTDMRVDSVKTAHSRLLELHRNHIEECRFEYFRKKLTK